MRYIQDNSADNTVCPERLDFPKASGTGNDAKRPRHEIVRNTDTNVEIVVYSTGTSITIRDRL
jgi:hypothetical protein